MALSTLLSTPMLLLLSPVGRSKLLAISMSMQLPSHCTDHAACQSIDVLWQPQGFVEVHIFIRVILPRQTGCESSILSVWFVEVHIFISHTAQTNMLRKFYIISMICWGPHLHQSYCPDKQVVKVLYYQYDSLRSTSSSVILPRQTCCESSILSVCSISLSLCLSVYQSL